MKEWKECEKEDEWMALVDMLVSLDEELKVLMDGKDEKDVRCRERKSKVEKLVMEARREDGKCWAMDVMSVLARYLFVVRGEGGSGEESRSLGSVEALRVMRYLVSSSPAVYLLPASRSVRAASETISRFNSDWNWKLGVSNEVLETICEQMSGESAEVAENAEETLAGLCRHFGPLLRERAFSCLSRIWSRSLDLYQSNDSASNAKHKHAHSTIAVRCASATVKLVTDNTITGSIDGASQSLELLLATLQQHPHDALLQISLLDLLQSLADSRPIRQPTLTCLSSPILLALLLPMTGLAAADEHPNQQPDPILGGSALRLLSSISQILTLHTLDNNNNNNNNNNHYNDFIAGFRSALHAFASQPKFSSTESDKIAFVDAISSYAATSPQALTAILTDPSLADAWLNLRHLARPPLQSVVLQSVARVIHPPPPPPPPSTTTTTPSNQTPTQMHSLQLYQILFQINTNPSQDDISPTDLILHYAKSPFSEIRLGANYVLDAVAALPSGPSLLLSSAGFLPFLLRKRQDADDSQGMEVKHRILTRLLADQRFLALIPNDALSELERIARLGPHFVHLQSHHLAAE